MEQPIQAWSKATGKSRKNVAGVAAGTAGDFRIVAELLSATFRTFLHHIQRNKLQPQFRSRVK
jgi:hypothetical protein